MQDLGRMVQADEVEGFSSVEWLSGWVVKSRLVGF